MRTLAVLILWSSLALGDYIESSSTTFLDSIPDYSGNYATLPNATIGAGSVGMGSQIYVGVFEYVPSPTVLSLTLTGVVSDPRQLSYQGDMSGIPYPNATFFLKFSVFSGNPQNVCDIGVSLQAATYAGITSLGFSTQPDGSISSDFAVDLNTAAVSMYNADVASNTPFWLVIGGAGEDYPSASVEVTLSDIVLDPPAVPEPSTLALISIGIVSLMMRRIL